MGNVSSENHNAISRSMTQHYIWIIWISLLVSGLSSCATIITKKTYTASFHSNGYNASIQIADSTYNLPANVLLERSKKELQVKLITDTITKDYTIKASPNSAFLYGNLLWIYFSPVAYLVDFTNQKRFYYGKSAYLDIHDTNHIIRPPASRRFHNYYSRKYPTYKGHFNIALSLPWINIFYLQPRGISPRAAAGFMGGSAGIEYFRRHNRFLSLNTSMVAGFPVIMAAPIRGTYEMMSSTYVSISDNRAVRRYSMGYGINYAINTWHIRAEDSLSQQLYNPPTRTSHSLGLTFNGSHRMGKVLYLGIIYRPTLLTIYHNPGFRYEHLISIDFGWKFGRNRY